MILRNYEGFQHILYTAGQIFATQFFGKKLDD